MTKSLAFYGPNAAYALELYEHYQQDPSSVDPATRAFFDDLKRLNGDSRAIAEALAPELRPESNGATKAAAAAQDGAGPLAAGAEPRAVTRDIVLRVVAAARLARSIREYGHLAARIDPLGPAGPGDPMLNPATHGIDDSDLAELPASIVWPGAGPEEGTCLDAIRKLREIYCGSTGYDFDHIQDFDERTWLHENVEKGTFRQPLSNEERLALLQRLSQVEGLERFLHTVFPGQKRFSIEGSDALIPMLDELVKQAAEAETQEVVLGMAHRGRLNVLAHLLGKSYQAIFAEFHDASNPEAPQKAASEADWTGDVKYHLGASSKVGLDGRLQLTLADNPSHLEFINPVVEGFTRASQDDRSSPGPPHCDSDRTLAVTLHGDAAFPGEGVVAETLNLSRLPGYETGGTLRIIVNNQIGFTTSTSEGRSTLYASDLAKGFEVPIVHVNADDPEACVNAIKFASASRYRFHKDFLIDLVGYRRWGHNEGDEPAFTQPQLYAEINSHPSVRSLYGQRLEAEGLVSAQEVDAMAEQARQQLREARDAQAEDLSMLEGIGTEEAPPLSTFDTAVPAKKLRELNESLLKMPEEFGTNPKLERPLKRRRDALDREGAIDWGLAESLAFASMLSGGTPVRLSGQDTARGTFSHRHDVLYDPETGESYVPLQRLPQARASFAIYNSPLTEAAVLGFEYGYSVHAPEALVLWEAQFGDFANAGQVIIDQFIAPARAKWREDPSLVLLLPHGYEGQGPEHSSARLERYLQLAAEDNLRIVNCTTAAQYFHALRAQAASLSTSRRPLVLMTPKSLLRHPRAGSSLVDLSTGRFKSVLDDSYASQQPERVKRLIFCSGKVAIDAMTTAGSKPEKLDWLAIARIEQLYPFPKDEVQRIVSSYPNADEIVWLQEEPENMGAWLYIAPRIQELLPQNVHLQYIGRPRRSSTAEGTQESHAKEQSRIMAEVFRGERQPSIETAGDHDVS